MCAKNILILCSILMSYAESATYDQRQTGNLNVQVDLKDIHIFALMKGSKEEYVDYDYAYDYSEMTIKPQNGSTTAKPLNVTTSDAETYNTTLDTTVFELATEPTKNVSLSTQNTEQSAASADTSFTTEKSTTEIVSATPTPTNPALHKNGTIIPTSSNSTDCKKGFVLNHKGDCELKLQGTGNALLKLVKLSQRLKLKRENRRNQHSST